MRECVFRSERSWVKRRKPGESGEDGVGDADDGDAQGRANGATESENGHVPSLRTDSLHT
jgi:hypothetical protein